MPADDGPRAAGLDALIAEAQRVLAICNACRYCEGYCAVFPALERRLEFGAADVHYLASLCHNCGACLYACQYAPPHDFALNFPRVLAQVRGHTYRRYAWPGMLAAAFDRNGVVTAVVALLAFAAMLLLATLRDGPAALFAAHPDAQGSFYALVPHGIMAGSFGAVFAFAVVALGVGVARFWRDSGEPLRELSRPAALRAATIDAATLRYLDGGGSGCTYPREEPSFARRTLHHLTFYGFLLCFAATVVATIYHYGFGWRAPYPVASLPVVLGTLGGAGLLVGTAGLMRLRSRRDPALGDPGHAGMDLAFLVLLFVVALTGLLLLALRETRAMGLLLVLHLGGVLALFATLPYGKFVHGPYRLAALVRYHLERRRPSPAIGVE